MPAHAERDRAAATTSRSAVEERTRGGMTTLQDRLGRRDIGAGVGERIDRLAHRHDLALYLHFQAVERHRRRLGIFDRQVGAAGQRAQMCHDGRDPVTGPGDGAVHTLGSEEDRPLDALGPRKRQQRFAQGMRVVEASEAIECGNVDRGWDHQ